MPDMRQTRQQGQADRKRRLPALLAACLLGVTHLAPALAAIVNSVSVTGTADGVTVTSTTSTEVRVVPANPRLALLKTGAFNDGGDGRPDPGDIIAYRFTVTNTGNVSLRNIQISDPLVPVSGGPLSRLEPGQSDTTTFTATYAITRADIDRGAVANTASVSAEAPDGTPVSAVDGDTTALVASSGLTLAKAGILDDGGDGRADAGDTILYQFVVTNTGPTTLSDVRVSDPRLDITRRAVMGRALAALGNLLNGSDPVMTASPRDDLRPTLHDDNPSEIPAVTDHPTAVPPVPMGLGAARRLVQFTGEPRHPRVGDRVGILYSLTNTGDVPLFRVRVTDPTSLAFNDTALQIDPVATDTGTVLFTRILTDDEVKAGRIEAPAEVTARARNTVLQLALSDTLALSAMEHVDTLATAAITPAAVTSLAPGAQAVFQATYVLTQADVDAGHVENTAVASGVDGSGATLVSVDTARVDLPPRPAIALVKEDIADLGPDGIAGVGDTITYRFSVTNTGNVTLHGVAVTDPLVAVAGGPLVTLAPGTTDSTTFSARHVLTQADLDAGQVVNQATVTATAPGGTQVSDLSDATSISSDAPTVTTLAPRASVALVKTVSAIADLNANGVTDAGDRIDYALAVTNTGNVTLSSIGVTDPLAPVTGGPLASLAPGETNSTTFRAAYILSQADVDAGSLSNQAIVTATGLAGETVTDLSDPASPTGNQPTITVIPALPRVALVKTVRSITDTNANGLTDAGDIVHYAFAVSNPGTVTLTDITVSDPLVAVSGTASLTLAPGQTDADSFTASYTITAADAAAGRITNQASVTARVPDGRTVSDLSDNSSPQENDPTVTPVTVQPAVALLKRVEAIADTNGNGLTDAGDTISYRFSVTNTGNVPLTDIRVTDPLAVVSGGPLARLDAGSTDTTTFTAGYVLTAADVLLGQVSNQAIVSGTSPQGVVVSDLSDGTSLSGNNPTVTVLASAPGLAVVKQVDTTEDVNGNGLTDAGDIIHYRFAVTNTGNVSLSGITIHDPKAAVSGGPLASLAVSETDDRTFTAAYVITLADIDAGSVSNQATAFGRTPADVLVSDLSDPLSNSADRPTVTPLGARPGIALLKSVARTIDVNGNGVTDPGDQIDYAFTITNTGNQTLIGITVSDPLVAVSGGPLASLAPGVTDATTFTARYTITAADALAGRVVNQATVTASTLSGLVVNDLSDERDIASDGPTVVAVVRPAPNFSKTALDPELRRGERADFVIAAAGAGAGPLRITDVMPPGFSFVKGSATVNGAPAVPVIEGRRLIFDGLMPDATGAISLRLSLRAGTDMRAGRAVNRAELHDGSGSLLATVQAQVTIVSEHVFDCGEVIGRVFDDANRNGYPDAGEKGLPGVRVVTVKGLLVTTDRHGRFHVPCADIPDAETGSTFIMKLDPRTLPTGYVLTSENPRDVRLTRGKIVKLNFGAARLRQVSLDLTDAAFLPGAPGLRPEWLGGLSQLIDVLAEEPSVLNLNYRGDGTPTALAGKRLSTIKRMIQTEWQRRGATYRLLIETRAGTRG